MNHAICKIINWLFGLRQTAHLQKMLRGTAFFFSYILRWLLVEPTLVKDICKGACVPVVMGNTRVDACVYESI